MALRFKQRCEELKKLGLSETLTHPHCAHITFYKLGKELKAYFKGFTYFKGLAVDLY